MNYCVDVDHVQQIDIRIVEYLILTSVPNPFNVEALFVQSTRMQRFLKTMYTLSCWYSLDSSRWVLSDMSTHVPGIQSFFSVCFFASFCIGEIITTASFLVKSLGSA